jgi:hypothetical protein
MVISSLMAVAPLLLAAGVGAFAVSVEAPQMETYSQRLTLTFSTEQAARQARVRLAPLLGDKEWAVTCRWDDNNQSDLQMRDVMAAHGYRGNFYLNAPAEWFGTEIGRQLLKDGSRIGGHSMTHPFLPYVNRNHLFWEVAAVRMQWEALTDSPVCSFSFPFVAFRSDVEGDLVHCDIAAAVVRAGYYHAPIGYFNSRFDSGLLLSPLLPADGAPIDDVAKGYLADPQYARRHPVMSFSMHVWYKTPEAWAKFERQLDDYGHRPDWWYCNQNEYAAYRYQFAQTEIGTPQVAARRVTLDLRRPALSELNDAVPMTLLIEGVAPQDLAGAACDTAEVDVLPPAGDRVALNLHHDRAQALPAAIGLIENADNHQDLRQADAAPDFPALSALLAWQDGRLKVQVDDGGEPLDDVCITYRLPLAWAAGVVRHHIRTVAGAMTDELTPTLAHADGKYTSGRAYFAAQVDFVRAGVAGRLHLTCRLPAPERDVSYPQGGFLVLGPIPEAGFDLYAVAQAVQAGSLLTGRPAFLAAPGLKWHPESAQAADLLDPEVVETSGSWSNDEKVKKYYLLRSTVESDAEQEATVVREAKSAVAVFVNGRRVEESAQLTPGRNELVVVAALSGDWFAMETAGCFLRLAEPGSGRRLNGIRYLAR